MRTGTAEALSAKFWAGQGAAGLTSVPASLPHSLTKVVSLEH